MKIPALLFDSWRELQRRRDTLQACRDRLHRAKADAESEFGRDYLTDKVFGSLPELHQRKVLKDIETRVLQQRRTAAAVALFEVEPLLRTFEAELSAFMRAAMRAPDPLDAWMTVTGGERRFVDDNSQMLAEVAHEHRLTRLLFETKDWQPSQWLSGYERAKSELADVATVRGAASFILFAESRHGQGWSGSVPASEDEERAAVNLRKLIASTQQSRIPVEVSDIQTKLEDIKKVVNRTRTLDSISPINPEHTPQAREVFEAELEAEAETAAQGAA
jgi:hypothetical protein